MSPSAAGSTDAKIAPKFQGRLPSTDGEVNIYDISEYTNFWVPETRPRSLIFSAPTRDAGQRRKPRTGNYRVAFVNGQEGNPLKHKMQACTLAAISGGRVRGVYNASHGADVKGMVMDTLKSAWGKLTSIDRMQEKATQAKTPAQKEAVVREHLRVSDFPATVALFDLLLKRTFHNATLVGHSQGNILICNAINGIIACRGRSAVNHLRVLAIASPTVFWERKDIVTVFNMANDAVGAISLHLPTMGPKAVMWSAKGSDDSQVITRYEDSKTGVLTHSFYLYMAELWNELQPCFP